MKTRQFILKNGQSFQPAVCPASIRRGKVGDCYDTCVKNLMLSSRHEYVEGYARDPITKKWIAHAWLTDGEHAFDPTWQAFNNLNDEEMPVPTEYIGFIVRMDKLFYFIKATGYKGVIPNAHRNITLAREAIPGLPVSFWRKLFI